MSSPRHILSFFISSMASAQFLLSVNITMTEQPAYKKNRILFANPHNPNNRECKNVTVKLSDDEGKTWTVARSIEPGISGYSDLAVGSDGFAYCFYERSRVDSSHYRPAYLILARFNLEWLTDDRFE